MNWLRFSHCPVIFGNDELIGANHITNVTRLKTNIWSTVEPAYNRKIIIIYSGRDKKELSRAPVCKINKEWCYIDCLLKSNAAVSHSWVDAAKSTSAFSFIYLFISIFSIMFFSSSTSAKQLEHQKYSKLATFSTAKSLRASAVFVLAAAPFEFESRTLWLPVNSWNNGHSSCQSASLL